MSIISLAGSRADREEVRASPLPRPPLGFEAIASDGLHVQAAGGAPIIATEGRPARSGSRANGADGPPTRTMSDMLSAVTAYIPTEMIAVYTMIIGTTVSDSGPPGPGTPPPHLPMWGFGAFLAAVPLVVWLLYAVRKVEAGAAIPWSPRRWPWWEIVATTIAFTAWSAALPKSAFLRWSWFSAGTAAALLAAVSALLPAIGVLATARRR